MHTARPNVGKLLKTLSSETSFLLRMVGDVSAQGDAMCVPRSFYPLTTEITTELDIDVKPEDVEELLRTGC